MGPSPAHRLIPVRSELLQPGMFVAELDRSWLHSPFAGTGFLITTTAQLEQLRRLCRYVYVDPAQSDAPVHDNPPAAAGLPAVPAGSEAVAGARRALDEALAATAILVRGARRQGIVDLAVLARAAEHLVRQVTLDADTLHCCLRTDAGSGFIYRRAVGTAAVAAMLGHHLGFDRAELRALAAGGLLLDIGKIAVPVPILAKPGALGGHEQHYVRRHVERGLELVAGRDLPERALEMIACHHERLDGSGYPHRMRGTSIPLFGRLAAIADAYDAMTLNRRYAAAMSPYAALRQLEALREEKFDAALVHELVRALGTYPCGTLVELADGRLGMVCAQQPGHPLQPRVLVTHDARRQPLAAAALAVATGALDIFRALSPSAITIDFQRLYPVAQQPRGAIA